MLKLFKVLICIVLCFFVFPSAYSQISISEKDQPLIDVLNKIERETDHTFLYNRGEIDDVQKVSVDVTDATLPYVLYSLFKHTDITYTLLEKQIILRNSAVQKAKGDSFILRGIVRDKHDETIIGATLKIDKTISITDADGQFSINAKEGDLLDISYLGYISQKIKLYNQKTIEIALDENTLLLQDIVVTALGIKKDKKSLSYNVSELKSEDINVTNDANLLSSLTGKIAGVIISPSSSGIGGSTRVVLRGAKSLFGENNALYVLNGIPLQNRKSAQFENYNERMMGVDTDGLASLNPEDVASLSVLSGASASALYGNRGANGVILINTKKAEIGTKIHFSNNTSFLSPFVLPQFQNSYTTRESEFMSWGEKTDKLQQTPKDFFQTGHLVTNNISVAVGESKNQTFASAAITNSEGTIEKDKYDRFNFMLRNSSQLFNKALELDVSVIYSKEKNQNNTGGGLHFNPLVPVYLFSPGQSLQNYKRFEELDPSDNFNIQRWDYQNQSLGMQNPYWIMNRNMFISETDRYILNTSLIWNINSWAKLQGRLSSDKATNKFERKLYASTIPLFANENGNYLHKNEKMESLYSDLMASFDRPLSDDFTITANIGASYFDEKYNMESYTGHLFKVPNFFHFSNISPLDMNAKNKITHIQTKAIYTRVGLEYKNFLYMDATGRFDIFSQLAGTNQEYVFYPSVGVSTLITEIVKLPKDIVSFLKIRAAYAAVGNPPDPYLTKDYIHLEEGELISGSFVPATHLKPEMTRSIEFGIDAITLNDKLDISFTYYNSNTYNQLFRYMLPPSAGYTYGFENAGKVNNWGIELSAAFQQKFDKLSWKSNLIYSLNRNKIKKLLPEYITDRVTGTTVKSPDEYIVARAESYKMILREGGTMGDIYATDLKYNEDGTLFINPMTGNVEADATSNRKVGEAGSKYVLGFRNRLEYRNFALDFLIDSSIGGQVVSATQAMLDQFGTSKTSAIQRDHGGVMINGANIIDPEDYYSVAAGGMTGLLGQYTYSATNIRLREVSLTYNVPRSFLKNKLDVSLSLTGRNIWMIYNKAPFDPEITANTGTYYQGFDYFMPPSSRYLGFGINVVF